jgi:hypothetical protein
MKMVQRPLAGLVSSLLVAGSALLVAVPESAASPTSHQLPSPPGPARFDVGVSHHVTQAEVNAVSGTVREVTTFNSSVTDGTSGHIFSYSMIGKNPQKKVKNPAATIKTIVVPLDIVFSTGQKWDPTAGTNCDVAGRSALYRTKQSPLFVKQAWTWGGTSIGTEQETDAFQRANFWQYANPTGINPTFGVNLSLKVLPKIVVDVPAADSYYYSLGGCGNGLLGDIDINWFDSYLQGTVIPSLASAGVNASDLPLFLMNNVVEYTNGNPNDCCVLGYHNAYSTGGLIQTYSVGEYDNSNAFTGVSDITALSHELAEWTDDPFTTNPTDPWGHIGQVSGCQGNLEVGDPLSGTTFSDVVAGFTYHPQELAFFSWFYHQTPSLGVNGWYSDQGTFTSPAAACS